MRLLTKRTVASAAMLTMAICNANAAVVVTGDPQGVFPFNISTNPDAGNLDIFVGRLFIVNNIATAPIDGELTVDAQGPNTAISTDADMLIGIQEGTTGTVNVIGNGSAGSASASVLGSLHVGGHAFQSSRPIGGEGYLNISAGGQVTVGDGGQDSATGAIFIGYDGNSDFNGASQFNGVVNVDGVGSLLSSETIFLGDPKSGASGQLNVTNGARVEIENSLLSLGLDIGFGLFQIAENSSVVIAGPGSALTANLAVVGTGIEPSVGINNASNVAGALDVLNGAQFLIDTKVNMAGFSDVGLRVGVGAAGELSIDGAGSLVRIENSSAAFGGQTEMLIGSSSLSFDANTNMRTFSTGDGLVRVSNGAELVVGGDIFVGGAVEYGNSQFGNEPNSTGRLVVDSFATVRANSVNINTGGVLAGSNGLIVSDVFVNGGRIAPGNSPGNMTIDGNLTFETIGSILEIEVGGLQPGEFDVVNVLGDLFAPNGFTLELSFLNNFTPQAGDTFDFLSVAGVSTLDVSMINVIASGINGFNFGFNINNGMLTLLTSAIAPSQVPLPGALIFMVSGLAGLGFLRRKKKSGVVAADKTAIAA